MSELAPGGVRPDGSPSLQIASCCPASERDGQKAMPQAFQGHLLKTHFAEFFSQEVMQAIPRGPAPPSKHRPENAIVCGRYSEPADKGRAEVGTERSCPFTGEVAGDDLSSRRAAAFQCPPRGARPSAPAPSQRCPGLLSPAARIHGPSHPRSPRHCPPRRPRAG